ncbi:MULTISPECIES: DUF3732 domain-containing protein [Enterobacteriaceae]|uniref:DUF3732 domain-containing protein n=1 Tax=Enterobacteriaceae TaxID=543 RepID=UPI000E2B028B|nr:MULTISPECIES: DUF3732 domain-containing protein [Klebsiella]EKS6403066.1 DUF3732 domain-containing protein [Enterobacter hormaechei]EIW9047932.1 DUF3732 domain-containing protein [Klebsiella pneumoniae]EIY5086560.1 DUF3732 domain-containing protein [Klebsiella variicola]MCC7851057.1 DUF3732 domain-containing protein [Klebsiella pneumoniae]MDS7909603.1 DUF3732 domain-containing protein [Klebsiella pasteurii]
MNTLIHEMGVIDKIGNKHPVYFKEGVNIVTGKSSTGKSALIEIFDYCFGSDEYTVPKGVITDSAAVYYIFIKIDEQNIVMARRPDINNKAFFRREEHYSTEIINADYFVTNLYIDIERYKKFITGFFLDIDDVDVSLTAKSNRKFNRKAPTPSIRSFTSFMLQHQNLVANKHALFYRFDEKEKRDQVIEHTKIFLGLVDQEFFIQSQEKERLTLELNKLLREKENNSRVSTKQKQRLSPVLNQLYALMGFESEPISLNVILLNPRDAKEKLDKIIVPEKINYNSNATTEFYNNLKKQLNLKVSELRKLQRQASSIAKNIEEEKRLFVNGSKLGWKDKIQVASSVCPFCHTQNNELLHSAKKLQDAITKVVHNLSHIKPIKAKFESSLVEVKRKIEELKNEITPLNEQILVIETSEKQISAQKSLYENILIIKARLFMLLEGISLGDDIELDRNIKTVKNDIYKIDEKLKGYDIKKGIENANTKVNNYMNTIGKNFEFEESYKPINLHFSFETFDLYHLTEKNEKIYLRSMGSGANWLYSHISLFLALHRFFAELGNLCSIPSILFLDQPTQVYFPNFRRDESVTFNETKAAERIDRGKNERDLDDDIKAVENLFSQLSSYCNEIKIANGFSPQIIVTDHADDLILSNGTEFESLVNGNRWRTRGLIDPVPNLDVSTE